MKICCLMATSNTNEKQTTEGSHLSERCKNNHGLEQNGNLSNHF